MNFSFGILAVGAIAAAVICLVKFGSVDTSKNSSCPIMNFSNCSNFCDRCYDGCDRCNYVNNCSSLKCFYPIQDENPVKVNVTIPLITPPPIQAQKLPAG